MKRRILHLIPSFEMGGAERQLTYLCEGLDEDSARLAPTMGAGAGAEAILASLRGGTTATKIVAAKQRARSWTIDSVAARWEALYRELAVPGGSGAAAEKQP